MMDRSPLETAAARLSRAVEALGTVVTRRLDEDRDAGALEFQVHAANDDRARLAGELDQALARASALEAVNRDVSRRLDQALDTIRAVLKTQGL